MQWIFEYMWTFHEYVCVFGQIHSLEHIPFLPTLSLAFPHILIAFLSWRISSACIVHGWKFRASIHVPCIPMCPMPGTCPIETLYVVRQVDIFLSFSVFVCVLSQWLVSGRLLILHFALHAKFGSRSNCSCCRCGGCRSNLGAKAKQLLCQMNFSNSMNQAAASALARTPIYIPIPDS